MRKALSSACSATTRLFCALASAACAIWLSWPRVYRLVPKAANPVAVSTPGHKERERRFLKMGVVEGPGLGATVVATGALVAGLVVAVRCVALTWLVGVARVVVAEVVEKVLWMRSANS